MCGIGGILQPVGMDVDERALLACQALLHHRGPDARGHFLDRHLGLVHTRLKIVDLSDHAAQPMPSADGNIVVTFNGEIYNWRELRRELEGHGYRFRSQCDTEVIVHGYAHWGEQCVERFNGMFAFALYDRRRGSLWLVRDRVGIKPLYYHVSPTGVAFASEIKALLALPGVACQLHAAALTEYLLYRSLSGEETLFAGIRALAPGHWLRVDTGLTLTRHAYWRPPLHAALLAATADEREAALETLLQESVALQRMGDVPVGAQTSGGLDSSLVTALMARQVAHPLETYSVGFALPEFDESAHALRVARLVGANHHDLRIDHDTFANLLPSLTWHYDEPLTHPNSAGIYHLCQMAKPTITVALTGEGADELFAGYHRYAWLQKCALARSWLPPLLTHGQRPWTRWMPGRLGTAVNHPLAELIVRATANGWAAFAPHLAAGSVTACLERRLALLAPAAHKTTLDQALYYDLATYLPPILMRQDKMSMAHGMETRVPYLDHRVVEAAFALAQQDKLARGQGKRVLKRIAARYLPAAIVRRRKMGFGFPIAAWLRERHGLGEQLDLILDDAGLATALVPRRQLQTWIAAHRDGQADWSEPLWTLLALETWRRRFLVTPAARTAAAT